MGVTSRHRLRIAVCDSIRTGSVATGSGVRRSGIGASATWAAVRVPPLRRAVPARDAANRHRQLRADDRLDAGALRGEVKARRAVDAVAIEQRERRIAERRGAVDERFGQRGAVEKREGGGGVSMQLDIHDLDVEDGWVESPMEPPARRQRSKVHRPSSTPRPRRIQRRPSVIHPLDKPLPRLARSRNSRQIAAVVEGDVPFVAIPALAVPTSRRTSATGRRLLTMPPGMPRRSIATRPGRPRSTATRTATGDGTGAAPPAGRTASTPAGVPRLGGPRCDARSSNATGAFIVKPSGRCVSRSCGEPQRVSPTSAPRRAISVARVSGDGTAARAASTARCGRAPDRLRW